MDLFGSCIFKSWHFAGKAQRSQDSAGGIALDFHGDDGYHRVERATVTVVPAAILAGFVGGEHVP